MVRDSGDSGLRKFSVNGWSMVTENSILATLAIGWAGAITVSAVVGASTQKNKV